MKASRIIFPDGEEIKTAIAVLNDTEMGEPLAMPIREKNENIIIVKKSFWDKLNNKEKKALVFHEAIHLKLKKIKWKTREEWHENEMEVLECMRRWDMKKYRTFCNVLECLHYEKKF